MVQQEVRSLREEEAGWSGQMLLRVDDVDSDSRSLSSLLRAHFCLSLMHVFISC